MKKEIEITKKYKINEYGICNVCQASSGFYCIAFDCSANFQSSQCKEYIKEHKSRVYCDECIYFTETKINGTPLLKTECLMGHKICVTDGNDDWFFRDCANKQIP